MSLPKLEIPQYPITLYDGTKLTIRPFLVKEEKILLIAIESKVEEEIIKALWRVCEACVIEKIDIKNMPVYDILYILSIIRAKSKGELINVIAICNKKGCEEKNSIEINLTKTEFEKEEDVPNKVELSDTTGVMLRPPTIESFKGKSGGSAVEIGFNLINDSIESIYDSKTVYPRKDWTKEELQEWIEGNLTSNDLEKINKYISCLPKMVAKVKYNCSKCNKEQEARLSEDWESFLV